MTEEKQVKVAHRVKLTLEALVKTNQLDYEVGNAILHEVNIILAEENV